MTMKKLFLAIAAVALVASASCTKVDTDKKAEKISFNVANYTPATKATSLIDENIYTFNCKAFMKGEGVDELQDFFGTDGETITPEEHFRRFTEVTRERIVEAAKSLKPDSIYLMLNKEVQE